MSKKKIEFKKDGMTGDALKFAEQLETAFNDLPEGITKENAETLITESMKAAGFTIEFKGSIEKEFDEKQKGSIKSILLEQGKAITDLQKHLEGGVNSNNMAEFKEQYDKAKVELEEIRKNGQSSTGKTFMQFNIGMGVAKAPAITTTSSSVANTFTETVWSVNGNVNTIIRLEPFVFQFVNVGTNNAPVNVWWDELPKEGDFAITAEGAVKPLLQYKFQRNGDTPRKITGHTVITDEFDIDYASLVSLIQRLMKQDLRIKMGSIIMADLVLEASAYTTTALNGQIDNADNYAAIAAAAAQLASLGYTPNVVGLNPFDAVVMGFTKANDGHYLIPPVSLQKGPWKYIESADIAPGKFFIGDGSVYNVDMKGGIIVKIGYVNDDLIKNQYTLVVEQFFYNYISTARKAGLIYGDFATIKTAIEKA